MKPWGSGGSLAFTRRVGERTFSPVFTNIAPRQIMDARNRNTAWKREKLGRKKRRKPSHSFYHPKNTKKHMSWVCPQRTMQRVRNGWKHKDSVRRAQGPDPQAGIPPDLEQWEMSISQWPSLKPGTSILPTEPLSSESSLECASY